MLKKAVALLFALLLLPAAARGEETAPPRITNAEGFVYILTGDDGAEIIGYTGDNPEPVIPSSLDGHPVRSVGERAFSNAPITAVTVSEGIRTIRSLAFEHCRGLTAVRLPEGLTELESNVFSGCVLLKTVNLPDSLTSVGDAVFVGCSSLETVTLSAGHPLLELTDGVLFNRRTKRLLWYSSSRREETYAIPEGTLSIGADAVASRSLREITVPDSVEEIGMRAFFSCHALERINVPAKVTVLDAAFPHGKEMKEIRVSPDNPVFRDEDGVLFNTETGTLVLYPAGREAARYEIPEGTAEIGQQAFMRAPLTEIVIPGSVKVIGSNAFSNCERLRSVTIPEGVEEIASFAFQYCAALTEIRLPRSVTKLGINPFVHSPGMARVTVDAGNPALAVLNGALVSLEDMRLVWYPPASETRSYAVPEGIRMIDAEAFEDCANLTELTLPEGVLYIRPRAFAGCSGLRRVVLPASLTRIDPTAFTAGYTNDGMIPAVFAVVRDSYAESFCLSFGLETAYAP